MKLFGKRFGFGTKKLDEDSTEELKAALQAELQTLKAEDARCSSETPLHVAATNGDEDNAIRLIANGANVNAKDDIRPHRGLTPLHNAAAYGHSRLAGLLLKNGAHPEGAGAEVTPSSLRMRTRPY